MGSATQEGDSHASIPAEQSPLDSKTSNKSITAPKIILRGALLGASAGLFPPLIAMIFRISICRYSLAQFNDIGSAAGYCMLPALVAGAVLSAAAASIGQKVGERADLRKNSTHRANRAGWIGTGIGMFLSLLIGAVFALMTLFPDC